MKYVVAVSGGVDSVVLLDMLVNEAKGRSDISDLQGEGRFSEFTSENLAEGLAPPDAIVVAHFDHGIRPDSADDAEFVRTLAERYGCAFETTREELGAGASEELARDRRYAFLNSVAKKHDATIMTAHHADDIVETIAINIIRGTGWRGLAALGSPAIERPLLGMTKTEIIDYAKTNELEWREDSTNQDTTYLRNDVRQKLKNLDEDTKELLRQYRKRQCFLRKEVDNEAGRIVGASPYSRYLLINAPHKPALELLRTVFVRETGYAPTRPQMRRALLAIKAFHSDRRLEVDGNISLHFTKTHFVVEHRQKVV